MRLGWLAGCLLLAVFGNALAVHARAEAPLTRRAILALPTPALARRLLGSEGADVVRIEMPDAATRAVALEIFLYSRPAPLGSSYCSQQRHYVALSSATSTEIRALRRGEPLRILMAWDDLTLARAPGCQLVPGQQFAPIRDPAVGMRALDALAAAQTAIQAGTPLPRLQVICRDEVDQDPDRCASGGREALRQLPLHLACSVQSVEGSLRLVEITLCTGGHRWVLRMPVVETDRGELSLIWTYAEGTY